MRKTGLVAVAALAMGSPLIGDMTPRASAMPSVTAISVVIEAPLAYFTFRETEASYVDVSFYERDAPDRRNSLTFYEWSENPDGSNTVLIPGVTAGVTLCASVAAVSYGQWGQDPAGSGYEFSDRSNVVCSDGPAA